MSSDNRDHTVERRRALMRGARAVVGVSVGFASLALLSACGIPLPFQSPKPVAISEGQAAIVAERPDAPVHGVGVETEEPPVVVVRDYWRSTHFDVVAWHPDDGVLGLRAAVRRDNGALVREHTLFVNRYVFVSPRELSGVWHAFTNVNAEGRPLIRTGLFIDTNSCQGDYGCSPFQSYTARVPDKLLRASRDGLVVRLVSQAPVERTFILGQQLITAYLATVDSVRNSRARRIAAN